MIGLRAGSSAVAAGAAWLADPDSPTGAVVTDLEVQNDSLRRIDGRVALATAVSSAPGPRVAVEPGETRELADVGRNVAAMAVAFDALSLEGDELSRLTLAARSYALEPSAGGAAAGSGSAAGRRVLVGLRESDAGWSEIEAFNPTAFEIRFVVRGRAGSGGAAWESRELTLVAGETRAWALAEILPGATGDAFSAEVFADGPRSPEVRAIVHARDADSRLAFRAEAPEPLLYLPVTGRREGAGGSWLTSDLAVLNADDRPSAVRVRFLEADRDGSAAPAAQILLGPGESRLLPDVLAALFGATEVDGMLELSAPSRSIAAAGILAARSDDDPTGAARAVSPIAPGLFARRTLLSDSISGAPRGVRLLNPSGEPLAVVFRALGADGANVGESATLVPAFGTLFVNLPASFLESEAVAVRVEADRPLYAAASAADRIELETGGFREPVRVGR